MSLMKNLWKVGREIMYFVAIVFVVWVLWITAMYYKAIYLAVQDILPNSEIVQVERTDFEVASVDAPVQEVDIDALLDEISSQVSQVKRSLTLEDYLDTKLDNYDFSFNDLPPGRRLLIGSIWVDAPIVDIPYASDEKLENGDFDQELREGVVKYPFTSEPGQDGNGLLFGHSSVTAREEVDNPFGYVFYKLPKLEEGDTFEVIWDGHRYAYQIDNKSIKWPEDVGAEIEKYDKEWSNFLTLMACYPLLSDAQRILVRAKQINKHVKHTSNIFAMN